MTQRTPQRRPVAEPVEPRILHSADVAPLMLASDVAWQALAAPASTVATPNAAAQRSEIAFVDAALPDVDSLIADLRAQHDAGRPIEVVIIGAADDGLARIGATLAGRHDLSAVHVLSHGSDGSLQLGTATLDAAMLLRRAGEIASWGQALTGDADLLLYGCDLARTELGQRLLQDLAHLTGADIAASTDLTGAAAAGGDWQLEYRVGSVDTALAVSATEQAAWSATMSTYTVTSTLDAVGASLLPGTLRWAISQANAHAGADTIVFAVNGTFNLTLLSSGDDANAAGDLDITDSVSIVGNGSASTVIRGNNVDRVFDVRGGNVSFSGLTIENGRSNTGAGLRIATGATVALMDVVVQGNVGNGATRGAGILNDGTLMLERVQVRNNGDLTSGNADGAGIYSDNGAVLTARNVEFSNNIAATDKDGGGLYIGDNGSATLDNVTFASNQAKRGGGLWNHGSATTLVNVTFSSNSASSQGGGVWSDRALSLDHVTIASNSASIGNGGGVFDNGGGNVAMHNSLFASNTGGNTNRALVSQGYNLSDDGSLGFTGSGDRSNVAAGLLALADNGGNTRTRAIGAASLARDAADPMAGTGPTTDQRGIAYYGHADIGAYEYNPFGYAPTIGSVANQTINEDQALGPLSFTVADFESSAGSLVVTATSSNTTLISNASLVVGGSGATRSIALTPNSDANDVDAGGPTTITLTVSDGYNLTTTQFLVSVLRVNDAPVLTLPAAKSTNEDSVLVLAGADAPWIGDVEAGTLQLTLSATRGTITLAGTAGLAFVTGTGSGNASMSFTGTQAAINAALDGLRFLPDADVSGSGSIAFTLNDLGNGGGAAKSASGSLPITIATVNDAPRLTLPGPQVTPEPMVLLFSPASGNALAVSDVDAAGAPLQLSLSTQALANGTLSFGSLAGLTLVSGTGNNDTAIVVKGAVADLNAALATLSFSATGPGAARIDLGLDDLGNSGSGGAQTASGTVAITVSADVAPVIALSRTTADYAENDPALTLDGWLTVSDVDNPTLASAVVRIAGGYAGAQDVLGFTANALTMGNIGGVVSGASLTLNSVGQSATLAEWQAALRAVTYTNVSESPSTALRTLTLTVNDGIADSAERTVTISVTAVNDAPQLTGANDLTTIVEDAVADAGTPVAALLAGRVADADAGASVGIAVIAVDNSHGRWQYTTDGGANWADFGTVGTTNARLLAADADSAVRFVPLADWTGSVVAGLSFRAWDQTSGSVGGVGDASSTGGISSYSANAFASGIVVTPVNDAPVLATPLLDQAATQGSAFVYAVPAGSFTDIDTADALSYTATLATGAALPAWLSFDAATQTFSGTPANADVDTLTIRVTARDGAGTTAADDFTLTVANINDAPTVEMPLPDQNAAQGQTYAYTVDSAAFADIDAGDTLAYSATLASGGALPSWLAFDGASARFSGTPGNGDVGSLSVRVTATDGAGASASDDFVLDVANVNDAPQLATPLADQAATQGSVFAYTIPANSFTDVDTADALSYTATLATGAALPAWLSFDAATQTFSGTPANADVDTLTIRVTARDGAGTTAADDFTLTVANINDAPTVEMPLPDQNAAQGQTYAYTVDSAAFADIDAGDTLAYSATLASGGALPSWLAFDGASARFSGTPGNGDVGSLSVRVTATDGAGASASDDFVLDVANVNDAPQLATPLADQAATQGSVFAYTIPANSFTDVDTADALSYTATLATGAALPAWLSFDAATLTFSGTPANADVDTLTIRVTARDGAGTTAADDFTLTVANINDAPTVEMPLPDQNAAQGQTYAYTVDSAAFADIDAGDTLAYSATLASGGALPSWLAFDGASARFSGTPGNGDVGSLSVRVTATDGAGASASDDFVLDVANVNDAPQLATPLADQAATQGSAFAYTIPANSFTDIDTADALSYTATLATGAALPAWLSFDAATQTFSGTPANADVDTLTIRVTARDGAGTTAADDFTLTVANINDAPTVEMPLPDQNAAQGQTYAYTVDSAAFADIDAGDTLAYSATLASGGALPSWLAFDGASARFSGTPGNDDVGAILIRVTALDVLGGSVTDDFALTVANVNDAPQPAMVLLDQTATQDAAYSYTVPAGTFVDIDAGDRLALSARLESGAALPSWLRFDVATQTFSGTPGNADVGTLQVHIEAVDLAGARASIAYTLTIADVNDAPALAQPLADRDATATQTLRFQLPEAGFVDVDAGDTLRYSASRADGSVLPSWLSFDAETRSFSAMPTAQDTGRFVVLVSVTDRAGAAARALFVIVVEPAPVEPDLHVDSPTAAPASVSPSPAPAAPSPAPVAEPPRDALPQPPSNPVPSLAELLGSRTAAGDNLSPNGTTAAPAELAARSAGSRSDAVLAEALVPQFSDIAQSPLLQLLRSDDLLRKFQELQNRLLDQGADHRNIVASSLAMTGGLSIGYVLWLVRGGVLVSSMLSALPAWQMVDPLPVLAAARPRGRQLTGGSSEAADDPNVERLFDTRRPAVPATPVPSAPQRPPVADLAAAEETTT